jgi:hypothetical protein
MSLKEMIRSLKMMSYKGKNHKSNKRKSKRKNRKSKRKNRKSKRKNRKSVSKSYKKYDGVINVDTNYTPYAFGCSVPKSFI